jgi:hypothetical protein
LKPLDPCHKTSSSLEKKLEFNEELELEKEAIA